MNEKILEELLYFQTVLEDENSIVKRNYHFRSVENLSKGILDFNDLEAIDLKQKLLNYFEELKMSEYELDSSSSSIILFRENLAPVGKYLIQKKSFRTKTSLKILLIIGGIIDVFLFYFFDNYKFPIAIIIFLFIGIIERKLAIKKGKFFFMYW